MKKKKPNQFAYLDEEEKELMESVDRGEWKSVLTPELKKHYEEIARYSIKLRKSKVRKDKEALLRRKPASSAYKTPVA